MQGKALLAIAVAALVAACSPESNGPETAPDAAAARPPSGPGDPFEDPVRSKTILFGDLHVHTTYSWDAFLFSLPLFNGEGAFPPDDACDFARFCSNLDFFALTDHAEALRPEHWEASKQSVRRCNDAASRAGPDLVAFMGFEWTQAGLTPDDHWGHRCVVFSGTDDTELPARPIASADRSKGYARMRQMIETEQGEQPEHVETYTGALEHMRALVEREVCAQGVPSRELPPDCLELAHTPAELHAKLDEWSVDALDIPHGTAWGVYTPATTTIDKHLEPAHYDPGRQRVIEVMSGHGNSEEYRSWSPFEIAEDGTRVCPEPSDDFLPCCWQAGELIRARCGELPAEECEARVVEARRLATQAWTQPTQVVPQASPEEWLDCDQCRDCFKPAYSLRPGESVQYAMALEREEPDPTAERRFRYGFIASSDIHDARAGAGYKQVDRMLMTDGGTSSPRLEALAAQLAPPIPDPARARDPRASQIGLVGNDARVQSLLYPSGLAAVHAARRDRESIWDALQRREVYGTSGPRILLWFDLLNAPGGRAPMGSERHMSEIPRFEVRAVGSLEQEPGCPDEAHQGLGDDRLARLCRGECYNPGRWRRRIDRIEVIRIRPAVEPGTLGERIQDPWRVFECAPDPAGCRVQFTDGEFPTSGRDALYYVRVLEESSSSLNGRPLSPELDADGRPISITLCGSDPEDPDCLGTTRERAWSSPIFVNQTDSGSGA